MNTILAVGFLLMMLYLLVQFARQEYVQDVYEDAIIDIEGRLDWARSRTFFPFGMQSQIEVSRSLLKRAQNLWEENKWHQAYQVALQSQEAINKAQNIYRAVVNNRK